ncbi:MAG: cation transporter [Anaerolineales bacterium]
MRHSPALIAFVLAKLAATRRYNYGFGRAEDIAGLFIVLSIAFSAGYILIEAVSKMINPQPIAYGGWVIVAALVGFIDNEAVAVLQIRVGSKLVLKRWSPTAGMRASMALLP